MATSPERAAPVGAQVVRDLEECGATTTFGASSAYPLFKPA